VRWVPRRRLHRRQSATARRRNAPERPLPAVAGLLQSRP